MLGDLVLQARQAPGQGAGRCLLAEAEVDLRQARVLVEQPALQAVAADDVHVGEQRSRDVVHVLGALGGELDVHVQGGDVAVVEAGAGGQALGPARALELGEQAGLALMAQQVGQVHRGLGAPVGAHRGNGKAEREGKALALRHHVQAGGKTARAVQR